MTSSGALLVTLGMLFACGEPAAQEPLLREGDVLFQATNSAQCAAIRAATGSVYTHCGILVYRGAEPHVLEAVQPVRIVPLAIWVKQGKGDHYVVKRLIGSDSLLTPPVIERMVRIGAGFVGKDYDLPFAWDDQRIYCSELVWKIYERGAGIALSTPRRLGDHNLDHPEVQRIMLQRYGSKPPLGEPMVSPADLFDSVLLGTVLSVGQMPL